MNSESSSRTSPLAALTLALGAFVLGGLTRDLPEAQAQERRASAPIATVVTAPGRGVGHNVLYVVEPELQRLLVFEHGAGGRLQLTHARDLQWDFKLEDFPSQKSGPQSKRQIPSVKAIREAVE